MSVNYEIGLVSVVTPTYKQNGLLERAIKSVLNQTYTNLEMLVVNDNNNEDAYTSGVKEIVGKFNDSRLRLILQEKHINGAAARNAGIQAAHGEYIAFLDDDDYWSKNKLERQIAVLSKLDSTWGGVTCRNVAIQNGKVCAALSTLKDGDVCKDILLRLVNISTDCILLRRKCLDETGYFDINLKRHQEVQLLSFFTREYKIKMVDEFLVYVDANESGNQPSVEKMEQIKKDFFESVKPVMDTFTLCEQKQIKAMHQFELGVLQARSENKIKGLKRCLIAFRSPISLYFAFLYMFRKVRSVVLAKKMHSFIIEEVN